MRCSNRPGTAVSTRFGIVAAAGILHLLAGAGVYAAVSFEADPPYPTLPNLTTVDPYAFANSNRGITETRMLRQTFQNPATFDVGQIILSFNVNVAGAGGMAAILYEVDDVNAAGDFASTNPVLVRTIFNQPTTLDTNERLGITLTESDIFTLPARNTGTEGYAIEITNADMVTTIGTWINTNTGTDEYPNGRYFREGTATIGGVLDFGLSLLEPVITTPGDVDGMGGVTLTDLEIIAANFRTNGPRSMGDLTGDGFVDLLDYREWKANYPGANTPPGSGALGELGIPEPASVFLVVVGAVAACGFTRPRRLRPAAGAGNRS